jgi:ribosomal protein S21
MTTTAAPVRLCLNYACRQPLKDDCRSGICSRQCTDLVRARKAAGPGSQGDSCGVRVCDYPSIDRALSALKKQCARAGITELARRHSEFVPKSERLRIKSKRARKRRVE